MEDTRPSLSLQWGPSLLASQPTACSPCPTPPTPPCSLNEHWLISPEQNTPCGLWLGGQVPFWSVVGPAQPLPASPPLFLQPASSKAVSRCLISAHAVSSAFILFFFCFHFIHHSVTDSLCDGPALMSPNSPSWRGLSMTHMWPRGPAVTTSISCLHLPGARVVEGGSGTEVLGTKQGTQLG